MLLRTLDQKKSRSTAERKLSSVGRVGRNVGSYESTSFPGLNAVATIQ
jgi:hypothetical protein